MFFQIVSHTPVWIWGLLAVLFVLGLKQSRRSTLSLKRVIIMPVVLTGLSVLGTISAFGTASIGMLVWALVATAVGSVVLQRAIPARTRYDAATDTFNVPGSWLPLALMMGIFATKYSVGISMALHLAFVREVAFEVGVCALYGAFSGLFIGRAARLCRLAWVPGKAVGLPA